MTKILVDAHYIDDLYQGNTTYIKGLFNELIKFDDLEIHVAAKNIERLKENFPDSRFTYIKLTSSSNIKRLIFEFPKIIKKGNYDYAHFTYFVPFIKNCKYIVTIHDLLFLDFPKQFSLKYRIERTLLFFFSSKMADVLLTISHYSKRSLVKHFGIKEEKIQITPPASMNIFKRPNKSAQLMKDKYLLYVSRIEHRKNHIGLLKAFLELKLYNNYSLVFVGAKSNKIQILEKYIETQPEEIRKKIIHFENLSETDLLNYYQNSSLFVFPSFGEGFGIPVLEALSTGAKVICSNTTAMEEFDFLVGYQFDPYDQNALKKLILTTLEDDNYPINEIVKKMENKYSWTAAAKTLHTRIAG